LPRARPLREVAADDQQRGIDLAQIGDEAVGDELVDAAEVDVGDVRDRSQTVAFCVVAAVAGAAGRITFSPPRRTR
jgi:hypothetical protein